MQTDAVRLAAAAVLEIQSISALSPAASREPGPPATISVSIVARRAAQAGVRRQRQAAGGDERRTVAAENPHAIAARSRRRARAISSRAPANTSSGPVTSRLCTPGKATIAISRGLPMSSTSRSSSISRLSARTYFQQFLPRPVLTSLNVGARRRASVAEHAAEACEEAAGPSLNRAHACHAARINTPPARRRIEPGATRLIPCWDSSLDRPAGRLIGLVVNFHQRLDRGQARASADLSAAADEAQDLLTHGMYPDATASRRSRLGGAAHARPRPGLMLLGTVTAS